MLSHLLSERSCSLDIPCDKGLIYLNKCKQLVTGKPWTCICDWAAKGKLHLGPLWVKGLWYLLCCRSQKLTLQVGKILMCLNETNSYFYPHGKSLQWTYLLLEGFKVWNMNAKKNVTFCSTDQTFSRVWQKLCFYGKTQFLQTWEFPEQDRGFALADTYTFLHCVSTMSTFSPAYRRWSWTKMSSLHVPASPGKFLESEPRAWLEFVFRSETEWNAEFECV